MDDHSPFNNLSVLDLKKGQDILGYEIMRVRKVTFVEGGEVRGPMAIQGEHSAVNGTGIHDTGNHAAS